MYAGVVFVILLCFLLLRYSLTSSGCVGSYDFCLVCEGVVEGVLLWAISVGVWWVPSCILVAVFCLICSLW